MRKYLSSKEAINKLSSMMKSAEFQFPSYIYHIRFPFYKNFQKNLRIDFNFPVTAFVGANGLGKTSALHALYGAPYRYSTGDFWFSTSLDPIEEGDGEINRYIYGHYNSAAKKKVETIKTRAQRIGNPDYWEPKGISIADNMERIPDELLKKNIVGLSEDRWNPVVRKVIYINFRMSLSAFDKYFYFSADPKMKKLKKKQDVIRKHSSHLKEIIELRDRSHIKNNKKTTKINKKLSPQYLEWIGYILNRNYISARYIRHNRFYNDDGLSVYFKTDKNSYSEAFAGSGEVAITNAVEAILSAKEGTLVLLDEPEVSLHPIAQERLLQFVLNQAVKKKLQVIFSTHSPFMIEALPEHAIKVFSNDMSGKFEVQPNTSPQSAFKILGVSLGGYINIIVEDGLAAELVKEAVQTLDEGSKKRFKVSFRAGGFTTLLCHYIPITMQDDEKNTFYLLDGDAKKDRDFIHSSSLSKDQDKDLESIISELVGSTPKILSNGNEGEDQERLSIKLKRKYIDYIYKHLKYLPLSSPEEIFIKSCPDFFNNAEINEKAPLKNRTESAKKIFRSNLELKYGSEITNSSMDSYARGILNSRTEQKYLVEIANILKEIQKIADTLK